VRLDTYSPARLIYLLRAGANTKYPELKNWIFKIKHDHVLAIPRDPTIENEVEHPDYLDYVDLVNHLIQTKPDNIVYTNAFLTEAEMAKLINTATKLGYSTIEKTDKGVKIKK